MIKNNVNFKGLWNTSTHVHFLYVLDKIGENFHIHIIRSKRIVHDKIHGLESWNKWHLSQLPDVLVNINVVQFIRLLKKFPACIALENLSMVIFGDKFKLLWPDQCLFLTK